MRKSNYSFSESIQNVFYVIKSRISFPGTRMIRFPIYVRGKNILILEGNSQREGFAGLR